MIRLKNDRHKVMMARMKTAHKYCLESYEIMAKRRAYKFIEAFRRNIKTDILGLKRLKAKTIQAKIRMGYSKPTVPLYGLGEKHQTRSYINMMRCYKTTEGRLKGFRVQPSSKKHHKSKLPLEALWKVHEFGCRIVVHRGRGRRNTIIRILARPAYKLTWARIKNAKPDPIERNVAKAMKEYIRTGKFAGFASIQALKRGMVKWDETGRRKTRYQR